MIYGIGFGAVHTVQEAANLIERTFKTEKINEENHLYIVDFPKEWQRNGDFLRLLAAEITQQNLTYTIVSIYHGHDVNRGGDYGHSVSESTLTHLVGPKEAIDAFLEEKQRDSRLYWYLLY